MTRRTLMALIAAAGLIPALPTAAETQSGYADVGGLKMYYEIRGAGSPLVVLHGALMTLENLGQLLPALAEDRQVIAIEQQAHGRTADLDRPLRYEQMADDTAALLRQLRVEQADLFGYRQLVSEFEGWRAEDVRAIDAPALVVVGVADVVRPEHAVELLRLLDGGVPGDLGGLPPSRLAVLPGTTHVRLVDRVDWLAPMIAEFLDAPTPKKK